MTVSPIIRPIMLAPPLTILCFGYHPWSPMWKRNQSMMAALARRPGIARVVFVNPEVSLLTPPRRLLGELASLRRYSWRGVWPYRAAPGIEVMTPIHLVPFRGRSAPLDRLDRALAMAGVHRRLAARPWVLFVNGVRLETRELVESIAAQAAFRVFDWSDDFAQFPRDPRARGAIESLTEEYVRGADLVLAVNDHLASRAQKLGARVAVVPNATGLRDAPGHPPVPGAQSLATRLRRPVLGYAGFINEHRVDLDLVVELARRHPDWTLFFLGVVQLDFDRRFPPLPNIVFHSQVPHAELADYLRLFDVCLIPHLANAHTAGQSPLKVYDYLTTGKPVVSTRIAGIDDLADVITIADTRADFIAAVEAAVASSGIEAPEAAAARRARAAEHTWEARARQVEAILKSALGSPPPHAPVADRSGESSGPSGFSGPSRAPSSAPSRSSGAMESG